MASFDGFKPGKTPPTNVPGQFFVELLPEVDHLGELKVTLYALWRVDNMEGSFRYLQRADFAGDARFMQGMGKDPAEAEAALDEALERAVKRGSLLAASVQTEEPAAGQPASRLVNCQERYYFLNSPKGRAAVDAIREGKWRPSDELRTPLELSMDRPNIFQLYEENIGPLTPMLSETLRDAQESYPEKWLEDAIRIAVENNKRSWRYVEAILRRWQEGGRDEQNRRESEKDRRRYAEWEKPER